MVKARDLGAVAASALCALRRLSWSGPVIPVCGYNAVIVLVRYHKPRPVGALCDRCAGQVETPPVNRSTTEKRARLEETGDSYCGLFWFVRNCSLSSGSRRWDMWSGEVILLSP